MSKTEALIDKENYKNLENLVKKAIRNRAERIELFVSSTKRKIPPYKELGNYIWQILDKYEGDLEIKIKNAPYCLLPKEILANAFDHIIPQKKHDWLKPASCKTCRFYQKCSGFPSAYQETYGVEIRPLKDIPREIMIEVEPRCNFNCQFCFNKNSFAKHGRNLKNVMSTQFVKQVIDSIGRAGVPIVRFTGGEPLLRNDIWELMKYAKSRGLKVRLNTNASLIDEKAAKRCKGIVSSVLIPIESWSDAAESKLTGYGHSLKKKIEAIKFLKRVKIGTVRAGTVASKENLKNNNLEKILKLVLALDLDEWEVYRPIPARENQNPMTKSEAKLLVQKLFKFKKQTDRHFPIANGIPFCIWDKNKVNWVSAGALPIDGNVRFVVDPRGFAKPDYYMEKNLGDPRNILKIWNGPFLKKMRNLGFLPKLCQSCSYKEKCRGGSRFCAKMAFGSLKAPDPLIVNYS